MKKILLFIFIIFIISCGTYTKPQIASHVLSVTLKGDTILVAIDKIRPNMYNSYYPVYSNPYYNNYHYRNYNYQGTKRINNKVPISGGTTYSPNSSKSISRIDFDKPIKRSKNE